MECGSNERRPVWLAGVCFALKGLTVLLATPDEYNLIRLSSLFFLLIIYFDLFFILNMGLCILLGLGCVDTYWLVYARI